MERICLPRHFTVILVLAVSVLSVAAGCSNPNETSFDKNARCWSENEVPTPSPLLDNYQIVYRLTDLPDTISSIVGPMANPGGSFNGSDLVFPGVPSRRLVFGGHSENGAFAYFEQGGFAPHHRLIVFRIRDGATIEIFSALMYAGANNLEQLRGYVERCEVFQ